MVVLSVVFVCGVAAAERDTTPPPTITRNASIQQAIERVARARNEDDLAAQLNRLSTLGGTNHAELVPQLLVYTLEQHDSRAAMVPAVILVRLGVTDTQLVEALLPYLSTPDARQRAQIDNWLAGIDARDGAQRDFRVYRGVIAARRDTPPLTLVRYIYGIDPGTGATVLDEVYAEPAEREAHSAARAPIEAARSAQRGTGLTAEQIAAARAALQALVRDAAWWQRLYAATVLSASPELRTPELVAAVQADRHPLVRDTLKTSAPASTESAPR